MPFLGHTAELAFRLCVQYLGLQLWEAPFSSFATSDPSTSEGPKLGEEMGVGGANSSTVAFFNDTYGLWKCLMTSPEKNSVVRNQGPP